MNVGGTGTLRYHWRDLNYIREDSDRYDYASRLIDFNIDLNRREPLPIKDNTFNIVYSSATLEHLTQETAEFVLSEAKRILKPNGGLHVTVPDAELAATKYEQRDVDWMHEIFDLTEYEPYHRPIPDGCTPEYFLLKMFAGTLIKNKKDYPDGFKSFLHTVREDWTRMEFTDFLDSYTSKVEDELHESYPGSHRNWFNEQKLVRMFREAGFDDVNRVYTRQSAFTELCHDDFDTRPAFFVHVEGKCGAEDPAGSDSL